jgi:2',3'-cyclic-nucleotide 2'-phosphodiesterase / 3'-nucleotidase / 5'-nucleotidase
LAIANPNPPLVSAGHNTRGSALSVKTKGKVVSEFLKLVGVSTSAVGIHEFHWGRLQAS